MKKGKKSSSGDNSFEHPYMIPEFWTNPTNWYWDNDWYSQESKDYLHTALVVSAEWEIQKKRKVDLLPK